MSTGTGHKEREWHQVKTDEIVLKLQRSKMSLLHLSRITQMQINRGFAVSSSLLFKDIQHKEEGKKIVVEGVKVPSPNTANLVTKGCREGRPHCHPFCRSPIVGQVGFILIFLIQRFLEGETYRCAGY